jgi:hypothetical protein
MPANFDERWIRRKNRRLSTPNPVNPVKDEARPRLRFTERQWHCVCGDETMRILGKRSLAATLKFIVDLSYYLTLFFGVVLILILAAVPLLKDAKVTADIPVRFELDREAYSITAPELGARGAQIVEAKGTLRVPGGVFGTGIEQALLILIGLGIVVLILRRLRGIFGTLKQGSPFVHANVSRIRSIGLLTIALEILSGAIAAWWEFEVTRHLHVTGLRLQTSFDLSSQNILTGVILIVLAEVFRIGADMKGDLEAARAIQFQLVPAPSFSEGDMRIHCHMRPANTVGGDYYDIITLQDGRVGIVVGDVSGKGLPAALLMTTLQGSLRTLISAGFRGDVLLTKMNEYLVANTPENKMVTLFFGELDTKTGELTYINAGHNPPLVVKANGAAQSLDSNSPVLGLLPQAAFPTEHTKLEAGDRLLIYTDGIVEASNKREEEFGEARLRDLAVSQRHTPALRFQEELYSKVLAFCQPSAPLDDMTLMIVERAA